MLFRSANGTSNDTLTAVYARGLGERHLKCGSNVCIKSTVVSADNADTLNYLTSCYATAAKDTLVVIADDGGSVVDLILVLNATEACLVNAVLVAKLLKLAGGATGAGQALLIVVGKKQLKIHLSGVDDLGRIGKNRHTVGARIYASGYHTVGSATLGYLNQAKAASADRVDVLQIAQSRNLNFCGSCCLKDSTAVFYGVIYAINFYVNRCHFCSPLS